MNMGNPFQLPLLGVLESQRKKTGRNFKRSKLEKTLSQIICLQEFIVPELAPGKGRLNEYQLGTHQVEKQHRQGQI